ncbi:hypothetical protein QTG54_016662 [Skeletonema marinoi]|uniref:WRKY19-like zinc finger domain-containing protein n=1 Tax=Skeletonema marinoi TaxID=267567 RepID=A0AAD8XSN3_9STRA|nr:hypothetical protein QTG54_016662 [Skeletonema marinoi]
MSNGAKLKRCSKEGCTNQIINGGVCVRHGAKVKLCSNEGCLNHTKKGGVCFRHGAKVKRKLCSSVGCTNYVQRNGVCIRHGAKGNRRSITKDVVRIESSKEVSAVDMGQRSKYLASNDALIIPNEEDCAEGCRRHGARRNPHDESTTFGLSCRSVKRLQLI